MGEWKLAPVEPTGDMMDAVRHLFQWLAFARPTEQELLRHCERRRIEPPAECRDVDHVPPKRMMAYWVYKGMLAASPAPSLPQDAERVVERLRNATMDFAWADLPDNAEIPAVPLLRDALSLIQSLSSQLAERDRLAAENERLREICRMLRDSYEPRTGTYALGELHQARESARAALASLEERG